MIERSFGFIPQFFLLTIMISGICKFALSIEFWNEKPKSPPFLYIFGICFFLQALLFLFIFFKDIYQLKTPFRLRRYRYLFVKNTDGIESKLKKYFDESDFAPCEPRKELALSVNKAHSWKKVRKDGSSIFDETDLKITIFQLPKENILAIEAVFLSSSQDESNFLRFVNFDLHPFSANFLNELVQKLSLYPFLVNRNGQKINIDWELIESPRTEI